MSYSVEGAEGCIRVVKPMHSSVRMAGLVRKCKDCMDAINRE